MGKARDRASPPPIEVETDMAEQLAAHLLETLPHLPAETIAEVLRIGAELQPTLAGLLTRTATECDHAAHKAGYVRPGTADPSHEAPAPTKSWSDERMNPHQPFLDLPADDGGHW